MLEIYAIKLGSDDMRNGSPCVMKYQFYSESLYAFRNFTKYKLLPYIYIILYERGTCIFT